MDRHLNVHGRLRCGRQLAAASMLALAVAVPMFVSTTALGAHGPRGRSVHMSAELARVARSSSALGGALAPYREGVVLVGFHAGVSASTRAAIAHAVGGSGVTRLGPAIKSAGRGRVTGAEFTSPFELRVPAGDEPAAVSRLRSFAAVAYAEPDYLMVASATPNDPSFPLQWGDDNIGQAIPTQEIEEKLGAPVNGTPAADDHALAAWQVSTGSRSIVVGEVDTGVDYNHPDLAANIWSNPGGVGGCPAGTHGYNVVAKACDPMDEDTTYGGHGTHVAGIIGAVGNNGVGVTGMNWRTTILPVRWMNNASWGETSALIESLQWLVAAKQTGVNVRVVNDSDTFFGTAYSQALSNEIDTLGANNILFVSSGGNTGNNNDEVAVQRYPCSYNRPNEICVAPTNNKDELPSWANYGPHTVDLAAPGVSIYSTFREGKYGYLSGSSMAAPQVSGAAALILSVDPSLSATALKADILENVDKLPSLAGRLITGGRLDVCKALPGCEGSPTAPPANTSAPTVSGEAKFRQTLTASTGTWTERPTTYSYQWQRCYSFWWFGTQCFSVPGASGSTYQVNWWDFGSRLRVVVRASNAVGTSPPASSAETPFVTF